MKDKQVDETSFSDILDPKPFEIKNKKLESILGSYPRWQSEAEALFNVIDTTGMRDALRYIEKHPPSAGVVLTLSYVAHRQLVSEKSRKAAKARVDSDPKQIAKKFIYECWLTWKEEPDRYKSKANFAREMLKQSQCKCLTSQKKIEDWCREWEKGSPAS